MVIFNLYLYFSRFMSEIGLLGDITLTFFFYEGIFTKFLVTHEARNIYSDYVLIEALMVLYE